MNIPLNKIIRDSRDETAILIADLYDVHPSYVRKAINGKLNPKKKETKKKIDSIIKSYNRYVDGKTKLLDSVRKLVPFKTNKAA